ncbi:tyrosine-type recombinase/integrase [Cribrihabitans sp. XS_ASV171]
MARALTTKAVEAAKPGDARKEIPDPALSGLYLVVQPSGAKSWALRYRYTGKPRKMTLGRWPIMGVADARQAASEALEALDHGNDPGAAKLAEKARRREADLERRDTIAALVEQYAKRHLSKLKSGHHVQRELERHAVARWGERKIGTITRRDVLDLLDDISDAGKATTANRVRAYLSKFFNWCVEREIVTGSPVQGIKPPAPEKSRDRVLSDDEIRWFWQACEDAGQPWGPIGKLLLLTGQRLGEVCGMTESELDGDTWRLPADRTKNGRAHDVPLSASARETLEGVERIKGPVGYIFTTTGQTPVSGYFKARNGIAARMVEIASDEAGEPVEIPHWTFHDLRRTAATGMARLGIAVRVTEAVLNHVSGTASGIVSVYQRHDYGDEKRRALEAWARLVADLVNGRAGNVVRISEKV